VDLNEPPRDKRSQAREEKVHYVDGESIPINKTLDRGPDATYADLSAGGFRECSSAVPVSTSYSVDHRWPPYRHLEVGDVMEYFEPLLKTPQAARLLGIHPKTLQKLAREGKVPAIRIGDLWRFRATELDLWLRNAISSTPPLVSSK
jgi:excisionase family DNA binding protein